MSSPARTRRRPFRAGAALLALAVLLGAGGLIAQRLIAGEGSVSRESGAPLSPSQIAAFDPFAFDPGDEDDLLDRGRRAYEHVLYAKSADGVEAAASISASNALTRAAAERLDVEADTLSALVFLESGGRPDVVAGGDPEGAAGLGQILAGTAVDLLGMEVDAERSGRLTRRIERERSRARSARLSLSPGRLRRAEARIARLEGMRRRVDDRFVPRLALEGAARYLAIARERFGREDLAVASYHMGIGNLESVIETYVAPRPTAATVAETVESLDISYVRLFYDSGIRRNPATNRLLRSLGDDSRTYPFRVEATREILRLWREDRDELDRLNGLHLAKASAEEVLRPEADNPRYGDADALRDALEDGELAPLPLDPARLGFRIDPRMGELAGAVGADPALYRALSPEALAVLLQIAKETRAGGGAGTVRVTSAVRDAPYQRELLKRNGEATAAFSLHTTGHSFDIARDAGSRRRNRTLPAVLDQLRAVSVIAWVEEPGAYHVTVGPDGERYLPLYESLVARGRS